ncbi:MAG TPA: response regulator transcription factor [Ktedonobacterales bacterium]
MRVYVISAYPTVRAGLRALVQTHPGWSVVGEGSPDGLGRTGEAQASTPTASDVDVVLADLDLPLTPDALDALSGSVQPRAGMVVVGAFAPDPRASETLNAAGISDWLGGLGLGLLPRDATAEEIVGAVEAVGSGLAVMDRRLARDLVVTASATRADASVGAAPSASVPAGQSVIEPLTPRELEVLQLVAQGLPNKTIAARLHVSEHTAKFHVASIMTKLGAASRTEAVTVAARRGLLML